jgi:hypothetical protein
MKTIAADETRHAALAASVAKWTGARLDAAARARIDAAVKGALGALRCEVAATPAFPADDLGLPRGDAGVALLDAFADALFDQGRA